MRPRSQYNAAMYLLQIGLNDCQIGRIMHISRGTIRDWRSKGETPWRSDSRGLSEDVMGACPGCVRPIHNDEAYAYLLGLYLGDGCISTHPRGVFRLRITLDAKYPGIIDRCAQAMWAINPEGREPGRARCIGCWEVNSYWKHWPCVFPQHGPGRKHLRDIVLADWQREIVVVHPKAFLRGLVDSDGCRDVNIVKKKSYPRYNFSNNSEQLHVFFQDSLDQLGVHWTRPSWKHTSVARRPDVAFLDNFIGPKF